MAVSALGLPAGTHLTERASSSSSSASSSSSSSPSPLLSSSSLFLPSASSLSSVICASSCKVFSEARRESFGVSSLASRPRPSWVTLNRSRVRSSFQADAGVAEPFASSLEASLTAALSDPSASSSFSEATPETGPPTIDLEFIGLEKGPDGSPVVDKVSVTSGEKLLRTVMNEKKLELYGLYGKIMNCGGGGSCGTCIVEVLEGSDLLNERTDAEEKYLKKNPSTWRLACQTIVGDKSNSGKVTVQRLPQKKK